MNAYKQIDYVMGRRSVARDIRRLKLSIASGSGRRSVLGMPMTPLHPLWLRLESNRFWVVQAQSHPFDRAAAEAAHRAEFDAHLSTFAGSGVSAGRRTAQIHALRTVRLPLLLDTLGAAQVIRRWEVEQRQKIINDFLLSAAVGIVAAGAIGGLHNYPLTKAS